MRNYSRLIGKITSTPWMITPDALQMILELVDLHMSGQMSQDEIELRLQNVDRRGVNRSSREQTVGILSIAGPIFPKANLLTEFSGGTTIEQFRQDFRSMMSDDSISSVLLDVDSPGGLSEGILEMADEIYAARSAKPIYAIANASANSAAYWLASQANQVFATPSAQVGSIGTYMVHTDKSRAEEAQGIDRTVIKAGRFKAVTQEPLNAESHAHLQNYVDEVNEQFIQGVARARSVDRNSVVSRFGEGGIMTPKQALEVGMIDGIATYDQVLSQISPVPTGFTLNSTGTSGFVPMVTTTSDTTNWRVNQSYDADKEHSEPGTGQGGEPTPREAPEEGDPAIKGGWRRDPPPPAYETEEEAMHRAWLEAQAQVLNVEHDAETPDDLLAARIATAIADTVVPLNRATEDAKTARDFREMFPDKAEQLERLETESRQNAARLFAEDYRAFESDANKGYTPQVREIIEEAHLKIAARQFSHEDLRNLLDNVSAEESVVPLGEAGSSRTRETVAPSTDNQGARQQFAHLVRTAMSEDNLTYDAAIEHVAKQNPELAQQYQFGHAK